ncbi:MAG: DNA-binding protein WhiA, partial [Firmicutes bacterium]|nr:DNA-binding protein WhiA [Bacillota bacterium]
IDLLNILGAHGQLLTFENVKIMKEMKNKTNRIMNCESANLDKTVNTAGRQIAAIEKIKNSRGLASLPPKLFEAANLRLDHPEATLAELAELADPPLAKSGLNHRLKKIEEIASKIEG